MSPAVGNFVQDLVEMAKATETLPIIQHENETLKADLSRAQDTIAARETAIISYKQQIDDLHAKVRSLEVERDDASFRIMELEDQAHKVLGWLADIESSSKNIRAMLDPPKPEPVKEPEPQPVPTPDPVIHVVDEATGYAKPYPDASQASPPDATQGQSESPPTVGSEITQSQAAPSTNVESQASVSIEPKSDPSHDYDPEPTPKWSFEWYQWNDRRNERARNVG